MFTDSLSLQIASNSHIQWCCVAKQQDVQSNSKESKLNKMHFVLTQSVFFIYMLIHIFKNCSFGIYQVLSHIIRSSWHCIVYY